MFGRGKDKYLTKDNDNKAQTDESKAPPLKPFSRKGTHSPTLPPVQSTFHPDIPRKDNNTTRSQFRNDRTILSDTESRKLLVGREICLKGEITSCEKLVVEGNVDATISKARAIEVMKSGIFRGMAEVDEADISGVFDGDLIALGKLTVRASGIVSGSIRYGRIVIESGGQISGDMKAINTQDDKQVLKDKANKAIKANKTKKN